MQGPVVQTWFLALGRFADLLETLEGKRRLLCFSRQSQVVESEELCTFFNEDEIACVGRRLAFWKTKSRISLCVLEPVLHVFARKKEDLVGAPGSELASRCLCSPAVAL